MSTDSEVTKMVQAYARLGYVQVIILHSMYYTKCVAIAYWLKASSPLQKRLKPNAKLHDFV